MNISELRQEYHQQVCTEIIRVKEDESGELYANFSDVSSRLSRAFAMGVLNRIHYEHNFLSLKGQTTGRTFEVITRNFIEKSFAFLQHLRPGEWQYATTKTDISNFDQYEHLADIEELLKKEHSLNAAFGGNYVVSPDIVVSRMPIADSEINRLGILENQIKEHARLTPLRKNNRQKSRPILHAIISCKWSIRSDRVQNARTEALNLIRNRKGNLPHIVVVTPEPYPPRIASIALGTGDIDCVYHFSLPELIATINESKDESSIELMNIMVDGRRLRDISDLPFDLAI